MGETFQSHDHEELTRSLVIRPDGEADNMGGETFYCDDYEQITGRKKDGTIRDGDAVATVTDPVEVPDQVKAKVVTAPPAIRPATSKAETK